MRACANADDLQHHPSAPLLLSVPGSLCTNKHADEPRLVSNRKGTVAFTQMGPGMRSTQMMINLGDNGRIFDHGGMAGAEGYLYLDLTSPCSSCYQCVSTLTLSRALASASPGDFKSCCVSRVRKAWPGLGLSGDRMPVLCWLHGAGTLRGVRSCRMEG
eukprot:COSAG06_NODE_2001_length_7869_cov_25.334363_9_plen_159_part_00